MPSTFSTPLKKLLTFKLLALCALAGLQVGCESPDMAARNAQIATEPRGDYYVARRYYVPSTRFWGYIRKPRQSWEKARLVVMDESSFTTPDRLQEGNTGTSHGYDNNFEYRVYGSYLRDTAYDPNSNLVLPVFRPTRMEVINRDPGFLFKPNERYSTKYVSLIPKGGVKEEKTGIMRGR